MWKDYPDQKVLFSSSLNHQNIIAAIGEIALHEVQEYGTWATDHFLPYKDPRDGKQNLDEPCLYVWEGNIRIDDGLYYMAEPTDCEIDWNGKIRKATIKDLKDFGFHLEDNQE